MKRLPFVPLLRICGHACAACSWTAWCLGLSNAGTSSALTVGATVLCTG